ncbi:MAG: hypothetical protein OEV42_14565 [Deltaproteobacteria bacterium]|nr:hypothetical protein [Deltaproteobacteria bacterium]
MKHLLMLTVLAMAFFAPHHLFASCWQPDEIARIEGFSELEEEIILSFKDALDCKPLKALLLRSPVSALKQTVKVISLFLLTLLKRLKTMKSSFRLRRRDTLP